jgi:site-specific DNA recombinase
MRKTEGAVRRVGISVRISKARDEQLSTAIQEKACRAYCEQRGWHVVDVYIDEGRSAYRRGVRRRQFERLMADVEAGVIDTVVVYRLDRLTRSAADFYQNIWQRLNEHDAEFVSVNENFDTTTAMGRAMLTLLVALAELESGIKSERALDWHEERTARGARPTGPRLFGYQPGYTDIVPAEAAEVRKAARRIVRCARRLDAS